MAPELIFALGASIVSILYGVFLITYIVKQPQGDEKMKSIARAIQDGAQAYLNRQYRTIGIVAIILPCPIR